MGSFEYLEDEAIADVAFRAYGENIEELFYQAGMATASLQTDISMLDDSEHRDLSLQKFALDRLLNAFLGEILFYKDAELLFAKDFDISIVQTDDGYKLHGKLRGGYFDHEKHPMHNDLKAITWHNFEVKETDEGWQCYVLIDI